VLGAESCKKSKRRSRRILGAKISKMRKGQIGAKGEEGRQLGAK
jgi:hypothetical protein